MANLAAAPLTKARLQIKEVRGVRFIDDSYNANPESMKAALRTLVELDADGKRVAVLGEMGELGAESERGHREVGEEAATLRIDQLIAIGTYSDGSSQDITSTVTWASSYPSVATINSAGLVTTVAQGTSTITATATANEVGDPT